MRADKEALKRLEEFHKTYPTPKDPVQEAIAAVTLLENKPQKDKLGRFPSPFPGGD